MEGRVGSAGVSGTAVWGGGGVWVDAREGGW